MTRYPDDTPLNELELSLRAFNCLTVVDNYKTVGEVRHTPDHELMRIPNLGKITLADIREHIPFEEDDAPKPNGVASTDDRLDLIDRKLTDIYRDVAALSRRWEFDAATKDQIRTALSRIEARLEEHLAPDPKDWPVLEQFNQMAKAVNQMAAFAAAMDSHKQELIELTSKRLATLTEHINRLTSEQHLLRTRMSRMEGKTEEPDDDPGMS